MTVARILGTGRAVPSKVLTNAQLEQLLGATDTWITTRTGIRERRIEEPGRATSDLAADAGRAACLAAGLPPSRLECIIVGTVTPDRPLPSTAVYVQRLLNAAPCAAFDVSAACTGFLSALAIGNAFIRTGQFARILVVGADTLSRIVNYEDRNTSVLFGDGAGAVVLGAEEPRDRDVERGLVSVHLWADGSGAEELCIPAGGTRLPTSAWTVMRGLHTIQMNGQAVFTHAVKSLTAACLAALEANKLSPSDVDLVLPHQANLRIIESVAQRCRLPLNRFYLNLDRYGNTSSASIPIALDEALHAGRITERMTLLLCAFGAGFTWGSAIVRW
jgi:3-oxoacyl-[acyl-carrier-protein] synthase III